MGRITSFDYPMDYKILTEWLKELKEKYQFIDLTTLGKTFMEREIWCVSLGKGEKTALYCGAHHAQEWVTSQVLMRFIEDFCESYLAKTTYRGYNITHFFEKYKLYIVPMLNPDGVDLSINGIKENNPFYDRLIQQNNNDKNFSKWQANLRGVDLNHNYNAGWNEGKILEQEMGIDGGGPTRFGGDYPESEPETQAICRLVRNIKFDIVLALHSQGEEIFYDFNGYTPFGGLNKGQIISRLTGYKLSRAEGITSYGGFKDWFIDKFDKPGYTLELGKGENPLPLSDFYYIYNKIAEVFIIAPML